MQVSNAPKPHTALRLANSRLSREVPKAGKVCAIRTQRQMLRVSTANRKFRECWTLINNFEFGLRSARDTLTTLNNN
jgi:hypothetical protein